MGKNALVSIHVKKRQTPDGRRQTFVIVNPQAAGGLGLRLWPRMADQLYQAIGDFEYEFTNAIGAATVLATKAIAEGYTWLIAVGGDGTVHEVVNGLVTDAGGLRNPDALLSCLPAGSGTDFWKTLGLKEERTKAIARLRMTQVRTCDLIRVELNGHDGRPTARFCCNVADVGLGGEVVHRAKRLPRWGSGWANYLIASTTAFLTWRPVPMTITVDGKPCLTEPLVIALVANGQYCGGGMWIAPEARLDDGLCNLCCIRPLPKWQFAAMLPRLYTGKLARAPFLLRMTGREIAITTDAPLKVTVDGEVPGRSPARFTILPSVLRIRG